MFRIRIDFLLIELGFDSLLLKIIMIIIIVKIFTSIMIDKMLWGGKEGVIDCSY